MSDTIVLLMKYKYTLPGNRKISRNMSAVTVHVQLMKREDAPTESQKWQDHVSHTALLMEYKYALPDNRKW